MERENSRFSPQSLVPKRLCKRSHRLLAIWLSSKKTSDSPRSHTTLPLLQSVLKESRTGSRPWTLPRHLTTRKVQSMGRSTWTSPLSILYSPFLQNHTKGSRRRLVFHIYHSPDHVLFRFPRSARVPGAGANLNHGHASCQVWFRCPLRDRTRL
ncbi:hypothetical protein B0T20DRAFT_202409 [Sordaria brevicollis]|uniref:Uncharacterized protein n=1 Tax=Sordaria brevicollis TaxID=83679 RepID=A0AAE0PDX2_SORBR|nr:hypothetical protein B0T20DRAFT_202409 [Sordaria brevicollis]